METRNYYWRDDNGDLHTAEESSSESGIVTLFNRVDANVVCPECGELISRAEDDVESRGYCFNCAKRKRSLECPVCNRLFDVNDYDHELIKANGFCYVCGQEARAVYCSECHRRFAEHDLGHDIVVRDGICFDCREARRESSSSSMEAFDELPF